MEDFILTIQESIDWFIQPILIIMLLGAGVFLTIRLGFIQFRRLGHGIAVTMGKYDDPDHKGDVSHFQALTTALSATVGIGNIAGVALAIHFGGPGAVFWMWVTAVLGMATKYTEVTLAQRFRAESTGENTGSVAGGPMYYIEHGLGKHWKPMAMFVAFFLMITAMLSGNAIQSNTISDLMWSEFAIPVWATGLFTALVVGVVVLGGIQRIGKVTGIIAPFMAGIYVFGGLLVLGINYTEVIPSFLLIFTEAFNPTAGIAGTGVGVFIQTMLWGVRRGLFSNEAGQGSASIAHAAAKTDEPVSEGTVALLEPLIDTLIICTITALVILSTGVWNTTISTDIVLTSGDISLVSKGEPVNQILIDKAHFALTYKEGKVDLSASNNLSLAWHEVAVEQLFIDEKETQPFTGMIFPNQEKAIDSEGNSYQELYGQAVENGAPLTRLAYGKALGKTGTYIVVISVFLFGISTSISWCYYGDRCIHYLAGNKAILPYKIVFVAFHFVGAITSLNTIWSLGDTALSFVTIPNVLALILLSGVVRKMTVQYYEEKPYEKIKK